MNGWVAHAHQVIREDIAPMLGKTAGRRALELIDQVQLETRRTTVIHTDITPQNVLFDSSAKCLSGVIDFGHMTIEDRARDFAPVLDHYGDDFLSQVLKNYSNIDDVELDARVRSRRIEGKLSDAVFSLQIGAKMRLNRRIAEAELLLGDT